ncbi:LAFE_0H03620g1_1 [Lachancea fermentati]|uniref:LAFE_0H03620g1_1 n=1 Tax=Lachancea fermentati TaxID=4955 RepID=A0A1G4MJF2_LACFM|nr:LAFE_0H03620g1_1 [Lachancea fermentati]
MKSEATQQTQPSDGSDPINKQKGHNIKDTKQSLTGQDQSGIASVMGFATFGSTKNKKVQPKKSGGKRVEKKPNNLKYRQYVNKNKKKVTQD